jgi:hypothetical protein
MFKRNVIVLVRSKDVKHGPKGKWNKTGDDWKWEDASEYVNDYGDWKRYQKFDAAGELSTDCGKVITTTETVVYPVGRSRFIVKNYTTTKFWDSMWNGWVEQDDAVRNVRFIEDMGDDEDDEIDPTAETTDNTVVEADDETPQDLGDSEKEIWGNDYRHCQESCLQEFGSDWIRTLGKAMTREERTAYAEEMAWQDDPQEMMKTVGPKMRSNGPKKARNALEWFKRHPLTPYERKVVALSRIAA